MDKIITLISSLAAIGAIVWWFFGKRESPIVEATQETGSQTVQIVADGGYSPRIVNLKQGVPAKLVFLRKDPSSCLEEVVMPDFGVSQKLPVNKNYEITIKPDKSGEFQYSCGMHMFFGKIIVK